MRWFSLYYNDRSVLQYIIIEYMYIHAHKVLHCSSDYSIKQNILNILSLNFWTNFLFCSFSWKLKIKKLFLLLTIINKCVDFLYIIMIHPCPVMHYVLRTRYRVQRIIVSSTFHTITLYIKHGHCPPPFRGCWQATPPAWLFKVQFISNWTI